MRKTLKIREVKSCTKEVMNSFILNCHVRGLSEATISNYRSTCNLFLDIVNNKTLEQIEKKDIETFILYLRQRGNNNTSIRTRIKILKAFFVYAEHDIDIPIIQKQPSVKHPYTEEEIKLLLEKPTINSYVQWRNHAIVSTLLATGIRCRTLQNLKVQDVDFTSNTIFLEKTKTNKQYYVPMSSTLKQTLKYYLSLFDHKDDDYLFLTLYGEQLARHSIKQAIRDYNLKRGVKKTSIHLFRHTFAINYLRNGGNIAYLQNILGHSKLETTKIYLHITTQDLQVDFDALCPLDTVKRKGIKINKK